MGLIKAAIGSVGGTLADQWKEFFYCDSLAQGVLVVKGQKRVTSRSSNTNGNDNIISDGSGIAVADGQCMIIVEQGKVVEFCAEPGQFTYSSFTEPSLFTGNLSDSIKDTFKTIGKRFTFGGDTGKDQRVYYFNTKEIMDNKFGTATPVPFRIVDSKISLDMDTSVRCNGVYSYRIADPLLFYTNVCGNVANEFTREEIDSQLKTEFVSALQPAFGELSNLEIRPNQIVSHTDELEKAMNTALSEKWGTLRGLEVRSVAIGSVSIPEDDQKFLQQAQRSATFSNAGMGAGLSAISTADAVTTAAGNPGGAMAGFMGVGMAQNFAGANQANLYGIAAQQQAQQAQADGWKCSCGATATGNFCQNCGAKKPESSKWVCTCGATANGNFCPNCGAKKPESSKWVCTCGTANEGKFCSNCGSKKPE